jgi:hypothetical protein
MPYGPTAYFGIFNTVLRHDIGQKKEVGTISEVYPHLILDKFTSQLGQRLSNILKHLFPVPKDDSKRVVTFANDHDYISFRHHTYSAPRGAKSIELKEVRGGAGGGVRRLLATIESGRGGAGQGERGFCWGFLSAKSTGGVVDVCLLQPGCWGHCSSRHLVTEADINMSCCAVLCRAMLSRRVFAYRN